MPARTGQTGSGVQGEYTGSHLFMNTNAPFAVITGASSGIGLELARLAAQDGYTLLLAADRPFDRALAELAGRPVETLEADLSTTDGVNRLEAAIGGRQIDVLCANAGQGLGKGFFDEDFTQVRRLVEINILGTLDLVQRVGRRMRAQGSGRILITGSLAGLLPGAYQAVYNASKSFIESFSYAIRHELKDTGVSVTCLMPDVTESDFWERADELDTRAGAGPKDSPEVPAKAGWEAMKAGKASVSPGWLGTLKQAILRVAPRETLAAINAKLTKPGSAEH